jgi:hypothetical protein
MTIVVTLTPQRERRSLLKTFFIWIVIFGISVTSTFFFLFKIDKDSNRIDIIYDMAANSLPTVRGELKPQDSIINKNSGSKTNVTTPKTAVITVGDNKAAETVNNMGVESSKKAALAGFEKAQAGKIGTSHYKEWQNCIHSSEYHRHAFKSCGDE